MSNPETEPKTERWATGNGAGDLSLVEAKAIKHTGRLKRTLVMASVFALLAMIYVPAPAQPHPFSRAHYRFIFSQHETGIAFFQLLVNVAFAATVGALAANIPRGFFAWFRRCFLSKTAAIVYAIAVVIGGLVLVVLEDQAERAKTQADQKRAAQQQAAEQALQAEQARRQAEQNERAEQLAAEQAKRAEIEKENAKRAKANEALAEKAFSEHKLTLAQDYYRAAANCWRFANRYDLADECIGKANRIGWFTEP
jgi:flagellar biosynthesis GTPase FlhF